MYYERTFTDLGGLIAYSPDYFEGFRPAAGYIDRILKGANTGDLPVQAPTSFELFINLKTAKVFGLTVPQTLLATANVIE
jgi:putative ABC transport system substrate-binding protein